MQQQVGSRAPAEPTVEAGGRSPEFRVCDTHLRIRNNPELNSQLYRLLLQDPASSSALCHLLHWGCVGGRILVKIEPSVNMNKDY